LNERIIEIAAINPVHIFGVNDVNIDQLRKYFPKLKIIARGNNIKVMGKDEELDLFEQKIERLVEHYNTFGTLTPNAIDRIMDNGLVEKISPTVLDNDIIVYGNNVSPNDRIWTNFDGEFEFEGLRTGDYTVYVYSRDTTGLPGVDPTFHSPVLSTWLV
jgi:hypothetical protein